MEGEMRKKLFTLTLALCVAAVASVAASIAKNSNNQTAPETSIVGYISDKACAKDAAKAESESHKACAESCIKKGSEAVLVSDGKIYKLDQQEKAVAFAGDKVKVTGSVSGDSISVTSIERE